MMKARDKTVGIHASQDADVTEPRVIPGHKKKHNRHTLLRILLRLLVVAALIFGGVLVWKNWDSIAPESAVIWLNEKLAGGQTGDGYPVNLTGSAVLNMNETTDGLAMLTDTAYVVYNSNGGEIVSRPHGFSNPIFESAGKWTLIAEAGGTRARLETRASTAAEMTVSNAIVGISVCNTGTMALATGSSKEYTSEVVVYDKHQKEFYHWFSSELTVVDVQLSPDGHSMVLAGIMADGGVMRSKLLFYDLDKKENIAEYSDTDFLMFGVHYFDDGRVVGIGDKAVWIVSKDGSMQQKQSYDGHEVIGYAVSGNQIALALRNYGSGDDGSLMTVNSKGELLSTMDYAGAFRSIAPCRSGVLLLTSELLYRTDGSGRSTTQQVARDGRLVCFYNSQAAVLGLTLLDLITIPAP